VSETIIQTAVVLDGHLTWSAEQDASLSYGAGKHRAKVFLGADIVTSCADHAIKRIRERNDDAQNGWIKTLQTITKDPSLTDPQKQKKSADVEREFVRIRERNERLETFDLNGYLYDLVRAVFASDAEFGQLTHLLKRSVAERKGRREISLLVENWRSSKTPLSEREGEPVAAFKVSVRCTDLMAAVGASLGDRPANPEQFRATRIVPLTWMLDWLMHIEALEVELGQSALTIVKTMAEWENRFDTDLREFHREMVHTTCCVKGLIDAVDLEQAGRKGVVQLRLRDGYISSFLSSLHEYQELADRFNRLMTIEKAGLVVVGMGGSGKTTFLRRCYDVLKDDFGNTALNEEIDPKSTAFVVGHVFKDIEVPLFNGTKKGLSLCWMDTAGSEDYRLLGQQLTISVREQRKKVFQNDPVDYNLLYVWSCEPAYDPVKDIQSFENVLTRFMEEVDNLTYFDLELPNKIYLLLNKADIAEKAGIAAQFKLDHERAFLRAVGERGTVPGESLGFLSARDLDRAEIARMMLVSIFAISKKDWDKAFVGVRLSINQGIVGNLLSAEDAQNFKETVYDAHGVDSQEAYFAATVAWIDRYLEVEGRPAGTRALLCSLRSFLNEVREGDEVAQGP
jgi:hypothetical protein